MTIKFIKMHGLGNDFIVIDCINQNIHLNPAQIASMAKRDTGIGFDQCLLVESSRLPEVDFYYRIFNADGQEVGQCGNGARCLALFIKRQGLSTKNHLKVATKTTVMDLHIQANGLVSVIMGIPKLAPQDIPINSDLQSVSYSLQIPDSDVMKVHAINVGNPHAVLVVTDLNATPVHLIGKQISLHPLFPEQTNVGFMQLISPGHIQLRVYERGCGETQACGSGAVAAAAIGRLYYQLDEHITVTLTGGDLNIHWPDKNKPITLTGPAAFVYEGVFF
ncbi:MAG: diaminopimelate epimerase [Legionella sp.]|nr:diaminopimelate epimerase [Legionella sp.]